MADKRLISSDIFTDEFYISLDMLGRNLWVGLIVTADDQGRFPDNPALIRSSVFPADDIPTKQISRTIDLFVNSGKLHRYEKDGKKLLQIVNWWKHQNPQYPAKSIYPAPDGWIDRVRQKDFNNKMIQSNWDKRGGFSKQPDIQTDPQLGNEDDPQPGTQDDSQIGTPNCNTASFPNWGDENENENENKNEKRLKDLTDQPEKTPADGNKKIPKPQKHRYGEFKNVLLTDDELRKYQEMNPADWHERIERLSSGIEMKGYKYKSHYLALLSWDRNEKRSNSVPPPQNSQQRGVLGMNFAEIIAGREP